MSRVTTEVIQNNVLALNHSLRVTANNLGLATVQMHSRMTMKTFMFPAKPGITSPISETLLSICPLCFYFCYIPNTEKFEHLLKNQNR